MMLHSPPVLTRIYAYIHMLLVLSDYVLLPRSATTFLFVWAFGTPFCKRHALRELCASTDPAPALQRS